ncbi:LysR family transcriptional regulator [Novosphingobium resinovorum]|uniref:Transcriptional regulator n=1 Tax=Novosphingobium resinovorum TaxID=158500 RepID=A0A031JUX2_9SPHN|nr:MULTISPECIES: LysR family transcriptional regulator [Novosphingobium]AOR79456.1 LysR family transcriptional regulator [Novosphingobium resinovorum]EZP80608.1 Transcriptional regulator [Novosphingobium resinovorum]MBF7013629.1 LysR family transcriptional regulator [Novosphingobium sp. HR1a]WJM25778.1 LysR family transcriptional regulator [Novosphingobium resinovorum]
MDNRFGEMQIFLAVAQGGSFASAAKALRLTPSAVSRATARLEGRLGVQLVSRTTRALALTAEGEVYRGRVAGLVAEIDEVERGFGSAEEAPRGPLRINASVPFGMQCLLPILPRFRRACPGVTVNLALSDTLVDLVEERADLAIRIGPLRDTGLKAKKLGRSMMAVVASPEYLREHGEPAHPRDLADHACLQFSFRRSIDTWPFRVDGALVQRPIEAAFLGNSGEVVRMMAVAGGGIARLGRFHVAADLAAGRLVEILTPFNPGDHEDIHALYVGHRRLASRIRAFLDFLDRELVLPGTG